MSAGVIIIRRRNNYTRGRAWVAQEKNSKKSHSAENCGTVPETSHSIALYIETNYQMLLPILIH